MDPRMRRGVWLAPGAAGVGALRAPGRDEPLPAVDAALVGEDERTEVIDGRRITVAPAEEPHGHQHFDLPGVLARCLAPGYWGAVDMLTRTDANTNIAPDVSVYPVARDAVTGGRQVEELVFEIIDSTRLAEVTDKARRLLARGVRRVFVLDVNASTVSEWSSVREAWDTLAGDSEIVDRCLLTAVPVAALLDELRADEAVARALLARGTPVLAQAMADREARGRADGEAHGLRQVLRMLLAQRGLVLTDAQRERVEGCDDTATLLAWTGRVLTATTADEVLGAA